MSAARRGELPGTTRRPTTKHAAKSASKSATKSATKGATKGATKRTATRAADERRFWLVKSEPGVFSFDDLAAAPDGTTGWEGVRNYQARNSMRDDMRVGDGVLFYHSNAEPTGVAGIAEVARTGVVDPTAFDPRSEYHDPASSRDAPRWIMVEIRAVERLPRFVTLAELRAAAGLEGMVLLQRGSRLSVQPVTPAEWARVLALSGRPAR